MINTISQSWSANKISTTFDLNGLDNVITLPTLLELNKE